jgi:hypothetical protein
MITQLYAPCANSSRPDKHVLLRLVNHVGGSTTLQAGSNSYANGTGSDASIQSAQLSLQSTNGLGLVLNAASMRTPIANGSDPLSSSVRCFGEQCNSLYADGPGYSVVRTTHGVSGNNSYFFNGYPYYETYRPLISSNTAADQSNFRYNTIGYDWNSHQRVFYLSWSKRHISILESVPTRSSAQWHAVFEHNDYEGSIQANVSPLVAIHYAGSDTTYKLASESIAFSDQTTGSWWAHNGPYVAKNANTAPGTIQILGGTVLNAYSTQSVMSISPFYTQGGLSNTTQSSYAPYGAGYGDANSTISAFVRRDLGNGLGITDLNLSQPNTNYRINLIGASTANNSLDYNFAAFPSWFMAPKLNANYVNITELSKFYITAPNALANDTLVTIGSDQYRYVNIAYNNDIFTGFLFPYF